MDDRLLRSADTAGAAERRVESIEDNSLDSAGDQKPNIDRTRVDIGGRYRIRTYDIHRVKVALYR